MRAFIGLLMLLAIAGCTQPPMQSGKKYLFNTERCADVAQKSSAEYKDCEKKLAHEDAMRIYNLNHDGGLRPGWVVLRSLN